MSLENITTAKSIQVFSLIPSEREFLIDFKTTFDVSIALTCEKAKVLKQFSSDLPNNVDLVVLRARQPDLPHATLTFAVASAPPLTLTYSPLLQPTVSSAASADILFALPLSLTYSHHMLSAPPLSLTHSQLFSRDSPALLLPHVTAPYHAQSARQLSSPAPLHSPDPSHFYINPAAGVGVRDDHASTLPPADAPVFVRHALGYGPPATAANFSIRLAGAVDVDDVRLGGIESSPTVAAAAFRQC